MDRCSSKSPTPRRLPFRDSPHERSSAHQGHRLTYVGGRPFPSNVLLDRTTGDCFQYATSTTSASETSPGPRLRMVRWCTIAVDLEHSRSRTEIATATAIAITEASPCEREFRPGQTEPHPWKLSGNPDPTRSVEWESRSLRYRERVVACQRHRHLLLESSERRTWSRCQVICGTLRW